MTLALFGLDPTLLSGDSDVWWCEFLMTPGLLPRAGFEARNADMARRNGEGGVTAAGFCDFYAATLVGRTLAQWRPLCERFMAEVVALRIPLVAFALVEQHRSRGDRLILTTATNRMLTELTAQYLGISHVIATEVEGGEGRCTGRTTRTLNMREGKLERLLDWLSAQQLDAQLLRGATSYIDSVNDLPLLLAVGHPQVADPDARLRAHAVVAGWPIRAWAR